MAIYPDIMPESYLVVPLGGYNVPATIPFSEENSFSTLISNYSDGTENRRQLLQNPYRNISLNYSSISDYGFRLLRNFFSEHKGMERSFSFYYPPIVPVSGTPPNEASYYKDEFVGIVPSGFQYRTASLPSYSADVFATGQFAPKLVVGQITYAFDTDYRVCTRHTSPAGFGTVTSNPVGLSATLSHRGDYDVLRYQSKIHIPAPPETLTVLAKPGFPILTVSGGVLPVSSPSVFTITDAYGVENYEDRAYFNDILPVGALIRWSFASSTSLSPTYQTRLRVIARFADDTLASVDRYGSGRAYDLNVRLRSIPAELQL